MDRASSCGCGEKWGDSREIVECQQDQDSMGRQEEVSLVTFGSPSMHFQQRSWGTNQSSGDLKSDHIISRLGQSAQGSKGSRYLVHPLASRPDRTCPSPQTPSPREPASGTPTSTPRCPCGESVYCILVRGQGPILKSLFTSNLSLHLVDSPSRSHLAPAISRHP